LSAFEAVEGYTTLYRRFPEIDVPERTTERKNQSVACTSRCS
jgi:hypothetical protein